MVCFVFFFLVSLAHGTDVTLQLCNLSHGSKISRPYVDTWGGQQQPWKEPKVLFISKTTSYRQLGWIQVALAILHWGSVLIQECCLTNGSRLSAGRFEGFLWTPKALGWRMICSEVLLPHTIADHQVIASRKQKMPGRGHLRQRYFYIFQVLW